MQGGMCAPKNVARRCTVRACCMCWCACARAAARRRAHLQLNERVAGSLFVRPEEADICAVSLHATHGWRRGRGRGQGRASVSEVRLAHLQLPERRSPPSLRRGVARSEACGRASARPHRRLRAPRYGRDRPGWRSGRRRGCSSHPEAATSLRRKLEGVRRDRRASGGPRRLRAPRYGGKKVQGGGAGARSAFESGRPHQPAAPA